MGFCNFEGFGWKIHSYAPAERKQSRGSGIRGSLYCLVDQASKTVGANHNPQTPNLHRKLSEALNPLAEAGTGPAFVQRKSHCTYKEILNPKRPPPPAKQ